MNRLGQQEARQPQMISSPPAEDSALVAAVLRKDRKATAEFVALYAETGGESYYLGFGAPVSFAPPACLGAR